MINFELISIVISFSALFISGLAVFFSGIQTKKASEATKLQQQLYASSYIVDSLTRRFYDLLKDDELHLKVIEPDWANKYWNLLATDFYFFHHGVLPIFIYSMWITDLANLYSGENGKEIRRSHENFLNKNISQYSIMIKFYDKIYNIAEQESISNIERNRKIIDFITSWISKNRENINF